MKVYIAMSGNSTHPEVFKTKTGAHKHLRSQGLHPLGGGMWGESADLNESEFQMWVVEAEVRE